MKNDMKKKKILVVDDDDIFHTIATSMMSNKYNVITSKSGKDALALLMKNKPDLILLDVVMPEMDGWETFHRIRGLSILEKVPIAFITSLSEADGLEQAQKLGALEYFTKPLDKTDFLNRIEKFFLSKDNLESGERSVPL